MNAQQSQIHELLLHEFKLCHNSMETIENICCVKSKGAVDPSLVSRWFKKFYSGCKNHDNQAMSGLPKTINSEGMLQAIETNLVDNISIVSGKLSISQLNIICHLQ